VKRDYEALFAELKRREDYLTALPGERLREDMEAMKRSLYTFGRNEVELSSHIADFLKSSTQAPDVDNHYLDELVRRLHNFLTSITTYIESQRVVMRHRWPTKAGLSEFEAGEYTDEPRKVFETGEAEFMTKLRNYCTHYNIPVPGLTTTIAWDKSAGFQHTNMLQLDRSALLRWNNWGASATAFLDAQADQFDFAPIIASYIKSTQAFFAWFWTQISEQSAALIADRNAKVTEVRLWWEENEPQSEWVMSASGLPIPSRSMRRGRALRTAQRYRHGTQGFRVVTGDASGVIDVGITDWEPLPR
jgi:hypothetical protein